MPDVYVKHGQANDKPTSEARGGVDVEKHKRSREMERKLKQLADFCKIPDGLRFETQEDEEEIVLFMRAHWIVNLPWILTAIVLAVTPLLVGYLPFFGMIPGKFLSVGYIFWYLVTIAFVFEQFLNWYFNVYIVTDERIVDVDFLNLLYKRVSDAKTEKIQDVTYTMGGVVRSLFNFGNVTIQTAAEVPEFEFRDIPTPSKVVTVLRALIDQEAQEALEGRVK